MSFILYLLDYSWEFLGTITIYEIPYLQLLVSMLIVGFVLSVMWGFFRIKNKREE